MKVLVDTCVWVDFFCKGEAVLKNLLHEDRVLCHPLVIGELATGNLPRRMNTLNDLLRLKQVPVASFEEVLHLVEKRALYGKGLQWNDCALLASAIIGGVPLWTHDRRLMGVAAECGCSCLF